MIVDHIQHADFYRHLGDRFAAGLQFLERDDLASLSTGRYEIDGDHVFAMVQEYETRERSEGVWEAHRRYHDIQLVVSGIECIGYTHIDAVKVTEPYDESKDVLLGEGEGTMLIVPPGTFVFLAPQDAHMPGQTFQQKTQVRKVVVKVEV